MIIYDYIWLYMIIYDYICIIFVCLCIHMICSFVTWSCSGWSFLSPAAFAHGSTDSSSLMGLGLCSNNDLSISIEYLWEDHCLIVLLSISFLFDIGYQTMISRYWIFSYWYLLIMCCKSCTSSYGKSSFLLERQNITPKKNGSERHFPQGSWRWPTTTWFP